MANKAAIAKYKKSLKKVENNNTHYKLVRIKHRCEICGRPRGYVRRFKMCRICLRNLTMNGELPGVKKISF